jgi:DNA repair photolyase
MSDAYMPIEKRYKLIRKSLEVIAEHRFPFHTTTKSNLILRDIDLLQEISKIFVSVAFTITTSDDDLAKKIEPYASMPSERFKAMGILSSLGIITGVTMMPILPFIEDNEKNIFDIVKKTSEYGGKFIYPSFGMTLRDRQRIYYYSKLDNEFPGMKEKYQKAFKERYSCGARNYKRIKKVFYEACNKFNISLDIPTYDNKLTSTQISLFDNL